MSIPNNYVEKVYAGLLGKCIGIRIGAPVEPTIWTYERIRKTYGNITGYVKDFKNFAADDDFNGPMFFIRALIDYGRDREITARDVGRAWLNYAREGKGFFWWGGYGRSTENTAYLNLQAGIEAPLSGSAETNGTSVAEQIGGQIFSDTWGLVLPDNCSEAARYAEMAASVSHDGNGIYGGRFIAAAISAAFTTSSIDEIIDRALATIPDTCEYRRVVNAVRDFHTEQPENFRQCMDFLTAEFGYDRYPGVCHIIPNAGVCALALLYGEGNLSRSVEIATMCGWDTDCNAGNVGTIVGVASGLEGVEDKYRRPMNDLFVCSSIAGSLNIVDLPTAAKQLAMIGYGLLDSEVPNGITQSTRYRELFFDFELPGATHGFRSNANTLQVAPVTDDRKPGVLEVLVDRHPKGSEGKIFYKPFYRREDFDDERYSPAFSPLVYSGQKMRVKVMLEKWNGEAIDLTPYVRTSSTKRELEGGSLALEPGKWELVEFTLPDTQGEVIDEIGLKLNVMKGLRYLGKLYLDDFEVSGPASYSIDFAKQSSEFATITPGTTNRGDWTLEGGRLHAMSIGPAEFYTGNYYAADYRYETTILPRAGRGHCVVFRAKGAQMGYVAGLTDEGRAGLYRNSDGLTPIAECDFDWQFGAQYAVTVTAKGPHIEIAINGQSLFELTDDAFDHGMVGFYRSGRGRCEYGSIRVTEL